MARRKKSKQRARSLRDLLRESRHTKKHRVRETVKNTA